MFSKLALFFTASIAVCAIANPAPANEPADKCNIFNDPFLCCKSLEAPSAAEASRQLKLVGVPAKSVTGQVGIKCNPIMMTVESFGSGSEGSGCSDSPVCCRKYFDDHHLGVNCTPFKKPDGA